MAFKNFSIWRGKLPHWRADDVRYYVTFRHRRPLDAAECALLLRELLKPDGDKWDVLIACALPENTELIFTVREDKHGRPYELSELVEKAKTKAGKAVVKRTGERFPPFYTESYDRIVRDDPELEERWQAIFDAPVNLELCEDPEEYPALWVSGQP